MFKRRVVQLEIDVYPNGSCAKSSAAVMNRSIPSTGQLFSPKKSWNQSVSSLIRILELKRSSTSLQHKQYKFSCQLKPNDVQIHVIGEMVF